MHEVGGGILAIVCDGVGISSGSNIAAKLCVSSIHKDFCSSDDPDYLERIAGFEFKCRSPDTFSTFYIEIVNQPIKG